MSADPISYQTLAERWGCCVRQAKRICRKWKLVPMDMGHKTKRFRPVDVDRAEARMAGEGRQPRGWRPRS